MSDGNRDSGDTIGRYLEPGADNVKLVYVLFLASVVTGLTILIGLVFAYVNRGEVREQWEGIHYTYQIRTFWIGLLYSAISVVLMIVGVGFLLIFVVVIWAIVRCVRGLQWAASEKPVPDPQSWTI